MLGDDTTYYYYIKLANKADVSRFITSRNQTPTFELYVDSHGSKNVSQNKLIF